MKTSHSSTRERGVARLKGLLARRTCAAALLSLALFGCNGDGNRAGAPPSGTERPPPTTETATPAPTPTEATPPLPFTRTEERADCDAFEPLRRPLFGELHVHTGLSYDAVVWETRVGPRGAYRFARGEPIRMPDASGAQVREVRLRRPLDFGAVTDHAEFLGEVRVCETPGAAGSDSELCDVLREPGASFAQFALWGFPLVIEPPPPAHEFCFEPSVDCEGAAASVWRDVRDAAEEFYDRSSACSFTTFVAYEYSGTGGGDSVHRNVIFRNAEVQRSPTSYLDTGDDGHEALWANIERECLETATGCDALLIPHNTNRSGGRMWLDPESAEQASRRRRLEPLVEIFQQKGQSECRFDRLAGIGVDTADELCTFEHLEGASALPISTAIDVYPRRNMVRNVLKDGLALGQRLGQNPFKLGFVGGTDSHNAAPGTTDEKDWPGGRGARDADALGQIGDVFRRSPGGLTVVWAEENSRDSIFAALRRRETYATSGTRPVVRFFGGWEIEDDLCDRSDRVARAYAAGAPMGGDLPEPVDARNPRFLVWAAKDPGTADFPGTDLQAIQIVKGWVDGDGRGHEIVLDVAGDRNNGAGVESGTCRPLGDGFRDLCAVYEDVDFDPARPAFYYARVLENPTCRWSTYVCQSVGVDPLSDDCEEQARAAPPEFSMCCTDESNDPFVSPTIQERSWTSPIWYEPRATDRATLP